MTAEQREQLHIHELAWSYMQQIVAVLYPPFKKNKPMTATEAHEIASRKSPEYAKVMKKITSFARNGHFEITLRLTPELAQILDTLTNEGYNVIQYTQEKKVFISW